MHITTKAPIACAATSGLSIAPAAHGAANTSRFLLHWRGLHARSRTRTDDRLERPSSIGDTSARSSLASISPTGRSTLDIA
jgi:hypothetical protein